MKRALLALLAGFLFAAPAIAQSSGFSQRGKVTQEMQADGFTMAHPSLPINSKVQVVNTLTGREIEVTVIRRITASSNRIADLSPSAWIELALTSNTEVRIYTKPTVPPSTPPVTQPTPAAQPAEPVPTQTPPVSENPETSDQINKLLEIMMEREMREAREREEAERLVREREAREREEAERIAREEQEARDREEAERIVREAREEAERITREAREEAERVVKDILEAREREAKEIEDARIARERENASRIAREAIEARQREEAERAASEREESARIAREREEASRLAREAAIARELAEAERIAKEREDAERAEREREEASRIAREKANALVSSPTASTTQPPAASTTQPPAANITQGQASDVKIIPSLPDKNNGKIYNLQVGAFSRQEAAMDLAIRVNNAGFDVVQEFTGVLYRVVVMGIQSSIISSAVQRLGALGIKEIWIRER